MLPHPSLGLMAGKEVLTVRSKAPVFVRGGDIMTLCDVGVMVCSFAYIELTFMEYGWTKFHVRIMNYFFFIFKKSLTWPLDIDFAALAVAGIHLPVFLHPITAPKNFFCLVERDGTLFTSI
jgi:hypothetical protein